MKNLTSNSTFLKILITLLSKIFLTDHHLTWISFITTIMDFIELKILYYHLQSCENLITKHFSPEYKFFLASLMLFKLWIYIFILFPYNIFLYICMFSQVIDFTIPFLIKKPNLNCHQCCNTFPCGKSNAFGKNQNFSCFIPLEF